MIRALAAALLAAAALRAADPWTALDAAAAAPAADQRKALEAILAEHPAFLPAHYNLGTALIAEDPAAAIRHLEQATQVGDARQAADAWHNLALARWKAGQAELAVAAMTEAAKRDPALAGVRDELRRAAFARLDEARRKAEEEARKLRLDGRPLPEATVNEPYRHAVPAAGGQPPYRFAPTAAVGKQPELPPGLALAADGTLAGTPTTVGSFPFQVAVQDGAGATASGALTLVVLPPPTITSDRLDEAVAGQPYRATLRAAGLRQPRWSATGLPAGLALDAATGVISGTPGAAGTATLEVAAADGARRATRSIPFVVADGFAPDLAGLPAATAWAPYRARLGIRGPAGTYRFQAAPAGGLTMAADGTIAGTPEAADPAAPAGVRLAATITAPDGRSRSVDVPIAVNAPPVIAEDQPIQLQQGRPAQRPLRLTGGTPPIAWRMAEGVLPKGVRLDPDGALRGAPGEVGSFALTVEAKDRWQATAKLGITVEVAPAPEQPQAKQDPPPEQQQGDQQQGDQGKGDQESGDQGKGDQQQAQVGDDPGQGKADEKGAQEQQQAAAMRAAAAERFLDQLPEQDRNALRALLLGGAPPAKNDQPW